VIIFSLFIWSLVTWMTAHVSSFEQLLVTRALMGISEACYIPAALALITDYHKGTTRSMATGIHMAGIMAGQSLGFIGGWIAENYYWTLAFSIFGIIGIVYSFILLFSLKDAPEDVPANKDYGSPDVRFFGGLKTLFKAKSFFLLVVFWSLLSIISWVIVGWLPTFYKEHFQLSQSVAGLYATGFLHPASILGVLLGGFLADKWSKSNAVRRIDLPVLGLCIAAPCIFLASSTSVLPVAILCFLLYVLTKSFSDVNMMPILCLVVDSRYRATGYGFLNLFSCIIGGIGLFSGGALRDSHISLATVFQFSVGLIVICIFLLLKVKANTKSS
jgi:MFS family permease